MDASNVRKAAAGIAASAALFTSLMLSEGFVGTATKPLPNDRPTYGYGSTFKADGSPVRLGDQITRTEARLLLQQKVADAYEAGVKRCAGDVPMLQHEYEFLVDAAYNFGVNKVCESSMVRRFREGRYAEGCAAIYRYDVLFGHHCLTGMEVPGCKGIMARRKKQYDMCMGVEK